MWYMVSRVEYCVDIVFADSAHCVSVVWWVVHVSDQSCFFMQDEEGEKYGVGERDVKFTEVEQTLSGMGRLEKLVLGIEYGVSLRWYNIVVTNCTNALAQGM